MEPSSGNANPPGTILIDEDTGEVAAYGVPITQQQWDKKRAWIIRKYGKFWPIFPSVKRVLDHDLRKDGISPGWLKP